MILVTSLTWPESFLIVGLGWLALVWWSVRERPEPSIEITSTEGGVVEGYEKKDGLGFVRMFCPKCGLEAIIYRGKTMICTCGERISARK